MWNLEKKVVIAALGPDHWASAVTEKKGVNIHTLTFYDSFVVHHKLMSIVLPPLSLLCHSLGPAMNPPMAQSSSSLLRQKAELKMEMKEQKILGELNRGGCCFSSVQASGVDISKVEPTQNEERPDSRWLIITTDSVVSFFDYLVRVI